MESSPPKRDYRLLSVHPMLFLNAHHHRRSANLAAVAQGQAPLRFHLFASAVIQGAVWYMDSLPGLADVPEPSAWVLAVTGGLLVTAARWAARRTRDE